MTQRDPYQGAYFTPSGGLVWHWRALWRRRYWTDFIDAVAVELARWQPPHKKLLLLGPSAGWCLPSDFLTRFHSIHAIDLDPLAERIFRFNHGRALQRADVNLTFELENIFTSFDTLLDRYHDHAILFPNMLGQHIYHVADTDTARHQIEAVKIKLRNRHWASIHDRLSGKIKSGRPLPEPMRMNEAIEPDRLAETLRLTGEWVDHLTTHVLPAGNERQIVGWRLLDDWMHIVEIGSVSPN